MANVFDELDAPATQVASTGNVFDHLDMPSGNVFDHLDATQPEPGKITQEQLAAARDSEGKLDIHKLAKSLTPQQHQVALEGMGLSDLVAATSPAALSKMGANYPAAPLTSLAAQEVMKPEEVLPTMFLEVPEGVKGVLPRPQRYRSDVESPVYSAIAGATESVESTAESMVTGLNLALAPMMGGAPGLVKRAVQLGFAGQMASNLPELKRNIEDAETPREKAKAWSDLILNAGMAFEAGKEGFAGEAAPRKMFYTVAPSQEMLDRATTRNQQRMLAPEIPNTEGKPKGHPEILDGLHLARQKLVEDFNQQSPEVQKARQAEIDHIDGILLDHDRNAVNESAVRTAQPAPPTEQPTPPSTEGTNWGPPQELTELEQIKQQLRSSAAPRTAEAIQSLPPPEPEPPTSETPSPAEETKLSPIVGPAMLSDGEIVAKGKIGQKHADLIKEAVSTGNVDAITGEHGFHDEAGKPLTRIEAADRALATGLIDQATYDKAMARPEGPERGLHTEDLIAAQEKKGTAPKEDTRVQVSAYASKLPEGPKNVILDVLGKGKPIEEAAGNAGMTVKKAQEAVDRANQFLSKAKTIEPLAARSYVDEPSKGARADAPELEAMKKQEEGYEGGPGAMGPVEAEAMKQAQATTGLKKATVLVERLARGEEALPVAERQSETEAVQRALDTQTRDPMAPRNLVSRILEGDTAISRDDAALLLVERNRVQEDMRQADAMLNNPEASQLERSEAQENLKDLESQIDRLDRAQKEAGSQWGRVGRMYQQMIREDYTLEGIQRKMRTAKGGPLTEEERAKSTELADAMQKATEAKDAAEAARTEAQEKEDLKYFYEQTIKDLTKEVESRPKISKPVLDIAQKIVDRWKADADVARQSLRERLGRTSAGVDPTIVLDVARIMRAHVGEIGLDLAKVSARVLEDFGEAVKPYLKDAWSKTKELIDKESTSPEAKAAVKKGVGAKEKSVNDIKATAKAEATAGEELSNKTVYELARAHIKAGVHGEDAVMAAVHKDIKEAYPGATERDVRRAFSDYGKTKFPSQEAVAKELRELRTLTRLQESIDRLKEGQDALKTGPQRDKATQEIREKQRQLNELLKTRQGPPSPEKLASQEESRIRALQNRIADIDKELRTGERPLEAVKTPDSPAVEQLKAERDAMLEKLNEIRQEQMPKLTPEESYNKRRMTQITKQIAELQDRLATGKLEKQKPVPFKKTAEVAAAEAKLTEVRREVDKAIEKKKYEQLSPQQKFFKEALSTLRSITAIKILGHGSVGMVTHAGGLIFRPTRAAIYWKNFGRQFGMWAKPEYHEQLIYRLKNDPEFETWKKAGASIDPEKTYTDYGMYAQWLGKLGEAGARGFDALKLVRMEMNKADFARLPDDIKSDPKQADAARKLIAEINNKATGATPKTNPMGKTIEEGFYSVAKNPVLEAAFFAPRLYASRWGRVLFDPVRTARTLFDPKSSPVERFAAKTKVRNALEFTGTLVAVLLTNQAILSATGSKQNVNLTDPTKSDWLKFKVGGKTLTADGGLLDPVRLLGQVIWKDLLEDRSKAQQYREGTRYKKAIDTVGNYLRGKLAPPVGLAADIATGSDFQGRPLPFSKEKPLHKDQTPYEWGEWLLSQGPIPLAGAAKEMAADLKERGFDGRQTEVITKAILSFGLGMAGVHVGEDYSGQQRQSSGPTVKLKRR